MELKEIRSKIDVVDDRIAALYKERMALAKEVGLAKRTSGVATENTLREKEILNRVTAELGEDIKLYAKQVYNTLFDTSKAYQWQFINARSPVKDAISIAITSGIKPFPVSATVACQGIAGAYSSIAADRLFSLSNITYLKDFDSVFGAVEKGLCRYGILPIENSSVGSVKQVYDLMHKHNFYIVKSIKLRIQHCLLAPVGVALKDVKEVFSHEQAIGQCQDYIKASGNLKISIIDNTAVAAKLVAESGRTDIACICSKECAGIYGLNILASNIQDNDANFTRFIAISKKLEIFEDSNKISIMVNLPHEAGSLNKFLNKFSTLGLNLTKLESRPIANSFFEFCFYFDFEAKIEKPEVQNLIAELDCDSNQFTFLGSYNEII